MSSNLIDLIKSQLGPALIQQTAVNTGESESGISKAFSALLPMILGGLANNSDNHSVIDSILNSKNLSTVNNGSWVSSLLQSLFGGQLSSLITSVSSFAGIKSESTEKALHLVTENSIQSVAKLAEEQNLDSTGISRLLSNQKDSISGLLPAGLSLASLNLGNWAKGYGFEGNENPATKTPETPHHPEVTRSIADGGTFPDKNNNEGGSIWKWLLPLLLLLCVGYFVWKQCEKKEVTTTTTTSNDSAVVNSDTVTTSGENNMTTSKVDENIDLNGVSLMGYKGGMEDQMIAFLKADGYKNATDDAALKGKWYDFDHVNFKIGSSTELEASSEGQLQNLAAILKAFPDAKIKIGGYTDKTGNEADNVKLSTARANFIKDWLTKNGVGAQVLGAEGYGSSFATVDATASNEERAIDRKMSVRFAK